MPSPFVSEPGSSSLCPSPHHPRLPEKFCHWDWRLTSRKILALKRCHALGITLASGAPPLAPPLAPASGTLEWAPALDQYSQSHLDLPSCGLQFNTSVLQGRITDRRAPRPAGVHLRARLPLRCPYPARFTHLSRARRSRVRARARAQAPAEVHARLRAPPPAPQSLGNPSVFLSLPPTCYSPPELHPHWLSPPARPTLPPVGLLRARGGATAARTRTRGRQPGRAGGAGRVTWAGGRGGQGPREAILGATRDRRPPLGPWSREPPVRASSGLSWKTALGLRCSQPESLTNPLLPCTYLRKNQVILPPRWQTRFPRPRRQSRLHLGAPPCAPARGQSSDLGFSSPSPGSTNRSPAPCLFTVVFIALRIYT